MRLIKILRDEQGASIVEYALFFALITVVCIVAINTLGTSLSTFFAVNASSI